MRLTRRAILQSGAAALAAPVVTGHTLSAFRNCEFHSELWGVLGHFLPGSSFTFENCLFIMREHGFRHLPVVGDGKLYGLVSLRDLLLRAVDQAGGGRKTAS